MSARSILAPTVVLVAGLLTASVAAETKPATTEKAPAPAKKGAPKKAEDAKTTVHCDGPWIDRGKGKEACPPTTESDPGNKVNTVEDIYVPPKETS